jgi:hypothetical protein
MFLSISKKIGDLTFGITLVRFQQQSASIYESHFSTVPLLNLRYILMEPFTMFNRDGSCVFREKSPNGNAENEVSLTCYTP